MTHRGTHQINVGGTGYLHMKTECGIVVKRYSSEHTFSVKRVTCPECLRHIIMKREQELEELKLRLAES